MKINLLFINVILIQRKNFHFTIFIRYAIIILIGVTATKWLASVLGKTTLVWRDYDG